LIYFVYISCFRPADHRVESEPVENKRVVDAMQSACIAELEETNANVLAELE
jgi:dsDNA-specific endonuclease/ATPase MutS2